MASIEDGSKHQSVRASPVTRTFAIDDPRLQLLLSELVSTCPLQVSGPTLISNVVANPVVLADVDKCLDTSLEQGCDIVVRGMEAILSMPESSGNFHTAARVVPAYCRVSTKCLSNFGLVKVFSDDPTRL